jgi:hypothetical protein
LCYRRVYVKIINTGLKHIDVIMEVLE